MDIKRIFEDDFLIVVNKPPGILTVPTPKKEKWTLSSLLGARPAHRLDRETSGLIVFCKTKGAQDNLTRQFRQRKVKKAYIAFVHGRLEKKSASIAYSVRDNPYEPPKPALTKYKVLEYRKDYTVVSVIPYTGRTNQIRLHFKRIGHPLVGERRFAFARDYKIKFRRVALHSSQIIFRHPVSAKILSFQSELPQDMKKFLEEN